MASAAELRHTPNNINVILEFLTLKLPDRGWARERGRGMKQAEVVEVNEPLAMAATAAPAAPAAAAVRDVPQRVSCSFQVCLTRARRRRLCLPTEDQVEFRKPWHVSVPLLPLDSLLSWPCPGAPSHWRRRVCCVAESVAVATLKRRSLLARLIACEIDPTNVE